MNNLNNNSINMNFECLDFLPDAVAVQKDGAIIYVNDELCKLLRCNKDSILGKSLDVISSEIDIEIKRKSRMIGNSNYEFATLRYVTEERRQYNTAREEAEVYCSIFEKLPVSMFVTVNGKFEEVNREGLRLLGESNVDDVKGRNLVTYLHPEELEFVKNRKKILYNIKQAVGFEDQKIIRKSGEILNIESASFPFLYKGQNAVVTTIRDITKRKKLEIELSESKALYERLIDILPDGISIHDGTTYSFVSDSYAKMLGYSGPKEMIGSKIGQVVSEECRELMNQRVKDILSEDKILPRVEYKFITKQGEIKDIESTSVRFLHNHKLCILSSIRDITDKKKIEESRLLLERAVEYDRLRTEFFSNMSHELRTPLNILLSSLQLIGMYINNNNNINLASIRKYTGIMKQNCYRLLRLINNLLDITKIDSGFYQLNVCNHDIVKLVEDITQSVAEYIKEKDIEVVFDTDVEERIIGCDADKIERVILNLLSNSTKFTKPRGRIEVNIHNSSDSINISVMDTGSGIPKDKINSIFDRFIQVDKSLSRRSEGTGIGLALVKSLVEMHGGNISVASEYGEYTRFNIVLPAKTGSVTGESAIGNATVNSTLGNERIERMSIEFSDIYM